jgi:hypothetical protein
MIRTVFTPNSNVVTLPIPDNYIGTELEIIVFPLMETQVNKPKKKTRTVMDPSLDAWADMNDDATKSKQRKRAMERLLKRQETMPVNHWTDEELDKLRYEFLAEKYQ